MTGGETARFAAIIDLDIRELFVKVEGSGDVPSPVNDEHLMPNSIFTTFWRLTGFVFFVDREQNF